MAKDLDMMPSVGTAKNMLGRVFLGNGNTMGNVSAGNARETNRLLAQAMRGTGMPKGRGIYERMDRGVDMVQCWYSGSGEGYARVRRSAGRGTGGFERVRARETGIGRHGGP